MSEGSTSSQKPRRHVHLYFCDWTNESRAWRAGEYALETSWAHSVEYVGYKAPGLPNREERSDNQVIRRIGAEPISPGSARILRALSLPRWWRACRREIYLADVTLITAHSLAALPVGVWIAQKNKVPLLYDAHELESEREGWPRLIRRIARWVESWLIRKVDHTIVVNDSIRKWYSEAYEELSVSTVRNVPKALPTKFAESPLRSRLGIGENDLLFVYCGLFGRGRGLENILEVFEDLDAQTAHLVFIGYGPLGAYLKESANEHSNIHVHSAVPQDELITLLSGADVGICLLTGTSLSYRFALPNKVFEYAAARLGVLVCDGPELIAFAKQYPLARVLGSLEPHIIKDAVLSWSKEGHVSQGNEVEFQPPNWTDEKARLQEAYQLATNRNLES